MSRRAGGLRLFALTALVSALPPAGADAEARSWDAALYPIHSSVASSRDQGAQVLLEFELPRQRRPITSGGLLLRVTAPPSKAQALVLHAMSTTATLGPALAQVTVLAGTRAWHAWDITTYLAGEMAAGRNTARFALRSVDGSPPRIDLGATGVGRPELRYSDCSSSHCKPMLGVYVGNTPRDVTAFEAWLGRGVDGVLAYTGDKNWQDYDGSVGWAVGLWRGLHRPALWSVPLIPKGASLERAARGDYDANYLRAARRLAAFRPQDPVLYVRTAWEWNGDWFPWSVEKWGSATFIAAWRRFVDSFRSVSPRFRFDWCPSMGRVRDAWEDAYPGDAYVDVIGIDVYDESIWSHIPEPQARFAELRSRRYGLDWVAGFAARRHKPISVAEWGVGGNGSGDNPVFIQRMHEWISAHPVVYHAYWDSNADYPGQLSKDQYPRAGAKYRELFGK